MLKKAGFGLLMLILASAALDPFIEKFERPWNGGYNWPGNTSVVDYSFSPPLDPGWNAYILQASVDALDVDSVAAPYSREASVVAAVHGYSQTKLVFSQIQEFSNYGISPFLFDTAGVCRSLGFGAGENCTCALGMGGTIECTGLGRDARRAIASRIFGGAYAAAWKGTMDNGLDALENSSKALNRALFALKADYDDAKYMGICDSDVAGHEGCENASYALAAMEGNGVYADFVGIRGSLENCSRSAEYDDVPMIYAGKLRNSIGGADDPSSAIGRLAAMDSEIANQTKRADESYAAMSVETAAIISKAKELAQDAENEKLWKIYSGDSFGAIVGGDVASVNENAVAAAGLLEEARTGVEDAERAKASWWERGYFKAAMRNMSDANGLALQSRNRFTDASADADGVVSEYDGRAQAAIDAVAARFGSDGMPERANDLYQSARAALGDGRRADAKGDKFEHYVQAIRFADEAYSISPGSERDTNWSSISACADAEKLLARARMDGVDVSLEAAMYLVINKTTNASAAIQGCGAISSSVIESARYMYSALPSMRTDAIDMLDLCGADCYDLRARMETVEAGRVSGGTIIYPDAIGSLKTLQGNYSDIRNKAERSVMGQVNEYLFAKGTLYADNAVLDGESMSRMDAEVRNTVDYPGENLTAAIESPVEFSQDDLIQGAGNLRGVAYVDGKLSLYLESIGPLETKHFIFERNSTILRTERTVRKAYGSEDGSAWVDELRDITCDAPVSGFYFSGDWTNLDIDGTPTSVDGGFARKGVSEGQHTLDARYTVRDAYSRSVVENRSTQAGERTYHTYRIELLPGIDMEYAQTYAHVPQSPYLKEKTAITITGEKVSAAETPEGFSLRVFGLKAGKPASVEISYYIDNTTQYVRDEIGKLKESNLSDTASSLVDDAEAALAAGDAETAVRKIQEAYEQVETDRVAAAKLQADYDEYYYLVSAERERLERVLSTGNGAGGDFVDSVSARRDFLSSLLDNLDGKTLDEQVRLLKTYDKSWLSTHLRTFKKNASLDINTMYSHYLELGSGEDLGGQFAALRSMYKRFDASASLEDAFALSLEIWDVSVKIDAMGKAAAVRNDALASDASALKDAMAAILKSYSAEYSDAKGTRFESAFVLKADDAQAIVKALDADLKKRNFSAVSSDYARLAAAKGNMSATLAYLEDKAGAGLSLVKETAAAASGRLSEKDSKAAASLAASMGSHIGNVEFVMALRDGDEAMKTLSNIGSGGNYDIIFWLSIVFVCGVVALYYFKGKNIGSGKPPQKTVRRLEKAV